jgi:two-component system, NtrC family, sensor histidine kinase HydH
VHTIQGLFDPSMKRFSFAYPLSDASLTARFGFYSFLCIGIMATALWFIVSQYMISEILEREWQSTAQFVRGEVKEFLVPEDFKTRDRKSVGYKFEQLLRHITTVPDLVRFKVYNPQGVVIWSDDKRLVGRSFPGNDELREAIQGKIVADLSSLNKKENVFEDEAMQGAIEIYVPIYADNPRELLGVMETYKKADSVYRSIRKARLIVLLGALGGGLLLYVSLLAIVRQAEKQIREQQDDLFKIQSELIGSQRLAVVGEMAAAVAHGIGNPLSSIRAAAQVAQLDCHECEDSNLRQKMLRTLDGIVHQVDRMQKRMQGLLNFAKPMEPRLVPVEINLLLSDIIDGLKARFTEAGVSLRLNLDRSLPKTQLDANHVEQVFMGLLTNALEATPNGGSVTVRTKFHADNSGPPRINVSVEDTGEGIPIESRERIFEPFFTTKSHGTGIGLPLAKKFVERNGGTIAISDGLARGTKFDVTFPVSGR